MTKTRISDVFDKARADNRAALVAYVMAGDPDLETTFDILTTLADNGADIIELGAPFTDPMADGPSIQRAGQRSLKSGTKLKDVLALATRFRETNNHTPLIVMGYANPVHHMGFETFAQAASDAGVDGTIIVDLPPEEDAPLRAAYAPHDLAVIRLATPTSNEARMSIISDGASGFLYYVSVTGVTGGRKPVAGDIAPGVGMAQKVSQLPVCVGFGIKTAEQAQEMAAISDGVVVGSAFVDLISELDNGADKDEILDRVAQLTRDLSSGLKKGQAA